MPSPERSSYTWTQMLQSLHSNEHKAWHGATLNKQDTDNIGGGCGNFLSMWLFNEVKEFLHRCMPDTRPRRASLMKKVWRSWVWVQDLCVILWDLHQIPEALKVMAGPVLNVPKSSGNWIPNDFQVFLSWASHILCSCVVSSELLILPLTKVEEVCPMPAC